MRALLHVSSVTLTAAVHLASMAVALGAISAIYSQSIRTGLLVTAGALIAGLVGFIYSAWKIHKLRLSGLWRELRNERSAAHFTMAGKAARPL